MRRSSPEDRALIREDLAYHQARVLLLIAAVSNRSGHANKLDGLTKLAKLDFLVRYPTFAARILERIDEGDPRLQITPAETSEAGDVEAPMTRYKYGPWDDRYYPIIGALVGRGLVRYVRGRQGSTALRATRAGVALAEAFASDVAWAAISERCELIAEASEGLTGNVLKERIYERLPEAMDRPHRTLIQ